MLTDVKVEWEVGDTAYLVMPSSNLVDAIDVLWVFKIIAIDDDELTVESVGTHKCERTTFVRGGSYFSPTRELAVLSRMRELETSLGVQIARLTRLQQRYIQARELLQARDAVG